MMLLVHTTLNRYFYSHYFRFKSAVTPFHVFVFSFFTQAVKRRKEASCNENVVWVGNLTIECNAFRRLVIVEYFGQILSITGIFFFVNYYSILDTHGVPTSDLHSSVWEETVWKIWTKPVPTRNSNIVLWNVLSKTVSFKMCESR